MLIPADVPQALQATFKENYNAITKNSDNLLLFAGDHKLEKLHQINPEKLFSLAAQPGIGAFATHFGLIVRYGKKYPAINYIVKLNGKTNLLTSDPVSKQLWSVDDVVTLQKNSGLNIRGVGYTVYLGSSFESEMLTQAAQIIFKAHQQGLLAILWMYPRGHSVANDVDGELIAGAAGVASTLGADFVKIKMPEPKKTTLHFLQKAVQSAGNSSVLCSGGEKQNAEDFVRDAETLMTQSGIAGLAIGRNIFEHDEPQAHEMIKKLAQLVYKK